MPFCPQCKRQFDENVTECPTDRVPLVEELPFQTVDSPNTAWVEIAAVGTEDEARLLAGFLDAEDIPAEIESLKFSMEPVNLGTMSEIRVYVAAENEARAGELLAQRRHEFQTLRDEDDVVTDEGPADIGENAETVAETEES
ncbi:MAG: hypothetical protein ACRD2J_14565 [Thermoanaerobaculia bacterium]